jgi:hypothetical protein
MAHLAGVTITTDTTLGAADGGTGVVSRWRLEVTSIAGTLTVKAKIQGSNTTPSARNIVTTVGSTTTGSTITAAGLYDIEASGLSILLSPGGSTTYDAVQLLG